MFTKFQNSIPSYFRYTEDRKDTTNREKSKDTIDDRSSDDLVRLRDKTLKQKEQIFVKEDIISLEDGGKPPPKSGYGKNLKKLRDREDTLSPEDDPPPRANNKGRLREEEPTADKMESTLNSERNRGQQVPRKYASSVPVADREQDDPPPRGGSNYDDDRSYRDRDRGDRDRDRSDRGDRDRDRDDGGGRYYSSGRRNSPISDSEDNGSRRRSYDDRKPSAPVPKKILPADLIAGLGF
jgi:hypothetical protein